VVTNIKNGIFVTSLLAVPKEIGLEVNAEETEYIFMSYQQDAGQNHNMRV
jgi:hypothetical protein